MIAYLRNSPRLSGALAGTAFGTALCFVENALATPLLADAGIVPGVDTAGMTTLEKLLLVAIVGLIGIIGILFGKLEASRKNLYDDARADAAVDKQIASALETLIRMGKGGQP